MSALRVIVVGGGAAGFFAALACAQAGTGAKVRILEQGSDFLAKVRVSGGGRCNVTHACFDPRDLAAHYPRGERALVGAFRVFQPQDTIAWFEARGVKCYTQPDGCLFPVTDSSGTIIECFLREARAAGIQMQTRASVAAVVRHPEGGFRLTLADGQILDCDRLLLATGGCRGPAAGALATSLGHTLEPPVPSLFTFRLEHPWLHALAGLVIETAELEVPGAGLRERGTLLLTHQGVSGPVVLRLSAWGARSLHAMGYQFPLRVNWLPQLGADGVASELQARRQTQPAKLVVNTPVAPLQARLWEQLVLAAGIARDTRWTALSKAAQHHLGQQLVRTELAVSGKSLHKEEFVTCGGVRLAEVNFKTMESRVCPGLHFAGELLDIDGLTGGFNFQAAWTTGWLAGRALAGAT